MVKQRYQQYGMDKDASLENLNRYVEERLHGQLSPTSRERAAAAGKTLDAESAGKRVSGRPSHAKMPSLTATEAVEVPPIIQHKGQVGAPSGVESAFSKRLPEIQKVADEVEANGQYMGQRRLSQKQRIQSATTVGVKQKKASYLGPRIMAAQNILRQSMKQPEADQGLGA